MSAEPVSPADTPTGDRWYGLYAGTANDQAMVNREALAALLDERDVLLAVGERDKAEREAAESLAAMHDGRAQSLAAEVERLEQALRESNDLRRVQRHSHDALSRRNVELTEAGERDRRQIARLTEAIERFLDGGSLAALAAVLADEEDANGD